MTKLEYEVKNNTPYHERILNLLKQTDRSISSIKISLLVGLSMDKVDKILENLMKHQLCRRTTKKTVSYWKWTGD